MAYQINLTGKEIDERLQNVGTAEDKAAADGTLYARVKKNADDIAENKENVKTLIKRVDVVTGTANGAEALAKVNEGRINTVTGTANTALELAKKNQFNLGQAQATANTALKNSKENQDSVRNAQITANGAKASVEGLTTVVRRAEKDISQLKELNVVYPNNLRKLTVDSTPDEIKKAFIPEIGGTPGTTNTPHVGYLIKGNRNSDNQDDPDSTIISVEVVKIDDKDCHKFMYIDNNRDLVTMTVCIWGGTFKVIERSVVSNIDTIIDKTKDISKLQTAVGNNKTRVENVEKIVNQHTTTLKNHETRQTIIEKVVSGTQGDVYFTKSWLNLVFNNSSFNNVEVKLYRWSGNRYAQFEMFTRNHKGVSQELIDYEIILKQEKGNGVNIRTPYIHYNDDGTEERLCEAISDAFGGRISYNRYKKRRWRIQAFLNGKPITAPFDFRVSVDNNNNVSLTKGGMMRSVPASRQVKYDGYYDVNKWINCKVGEELDLNYRFFNEDLGLIRQKFPNPGDVMVENASSHTVPRGVIISVFQDTPGSYCILWSNGESIYEIGIDLDINEYGGYNCYSPAKKLCDDIYNYASKMNSGTLRDLYISAGAKYNEATGFYELNGLTDITEEEMRTIYNRYLIDIGTNGSASGWLILDDGERTNLPCITRADIFNYLDNGIRGNKVEVLRICAASTDDYTRICYVGNTAAIAHYPFPKLRKVIGVWQYNSNNPNNFNFSYGQPFSNCPLLEEIRMKKINKSHTFAVSPNISKESVQYMITNANPPSGAAVGSITITLHPTAYARLKDDADIEAALEAKGGIITLVSA